MRIAATVVELDTRVVDPMQAILNQYKVAEAPTALVLDEQENLFVWSQFGHALTRIDVESSFGPSNPENDRAFVTLELPRRHETKWTPEMQTGRSMFFAVEDQRLSLRNTACESCHPDGRDDGLLWVDGTATQFLAGRLDDNDAHLGWHGEHESVEERIRSTADRFTGTGFHRKEDLEDLAALETYMRRMPTPPPPLPHAEVERQSIERGRDLFDDSLQCASCHPGGGAAGTRMSVMRGELDHPRSERFDAPSLAHVAASPPYFHDNRYASLRWVFSDPSDPMDLTSRLSEAEQQDLVAYVETLPPRSGR